MKTVQLNIPGPSNAEKIRDAAEALLKKLTIQYFEEAKDAPFDKDKIFKKLNRQWGNYAFLANKKRTGLQVYGNAFQKRIEYVLEIVEKQQNEENESKGKEAETETPISQEESKALQG